MTTPAQSIHSSKRNVIFASCASGVIGATLFQRFHQTGKLAPSDVFGAAIAAVIVALILFVVVRRESRPGEDHTQSRR